MTFTKHVIERFQQRITCESPEAVRFFIQNDIKKSTLIYRKNRIEKRRYNDIIYIVDCQNPTQPKVVTLYIQIN